MAWFGESLSSLTGHLHNLTKEVLSEASDETKGATGGLEATNEKLEELEAVCTAQDLEISALKKQNAELRRRLEQAGCLEDEGQPVLPPAPTTWLSIEQRCDAAYAGGAHGAKKHTRALSDATAVAAKHQERLEKELNERIQLIEHLQIQLQKVEEERHVFSRRTSEQEMQIQLLTKRVAEQESEKNSSVLQYEEKLSQENKELKALLDDANQRTRDLEEELLNMRSQCLDHVIDSQVSASELRLDVEQTRKRICNETGAQKAENLRAHQDLVNRMIQMGEKSRESELNMKRLQIEDKKLATEMASKIQKLGDQEQQELIHGTLKALELENQVLNMRNAQLERESMKDIGRSVNESRKSLTDGVENKSEVMKSEEDMDNLSELSDFPIISQRFENNMTQLQNQVEMYKRDVKHYEMTSDNLLQEKYQLEELVENLQQQLQEQQKLSNVTSLQNTSTKVKLQNDDISSNFVPLEKVRELEQEITKLKTAFKLLKDEKEYLGQELEAMARVVQDLESKVATGQEERQELEASMEELDQQHQDAIDKLLVLRNAELVENEQLKSEVLEMKLAASHKPQLSDSFIQTESLHLEHAEGTTQTDCINQYDQENQISFINDYEETSMDLSEKKINNEDGGTVKYDNELSEKIRKLINFDIPNDVNDTFPRSLYLVQEIVKVVNDCKWKKDTLERKVAELIRENKDFQSTITILEAECTNLKDNVERLAEQLVGVAKSSKDPLPTILENFEEMEVMEQKISMLEEEVAVLRETRVNFEEDAVRMMEQRDDLLGKIRNLEAQQKNQENIETELQMIAEDARSSAQKYKAAAEIAEKARMSAEENVKSLSQELDVCVKNNEKELLEVKELAKNLDMKNKELLEEVMSKEVKLEQYQGNVLELELERNSLNLLLKQNTLQLKESENVLEEQKVLDCQLTNLQKELVQANNERKRLTKECEDLKENLMLKTDLERKLELTEKNLQETQSLIKDQEEIESEVKKWQCAAAAEELKLLETVALVSKLEEDNSILKEKLRNEELSTKCLAQKHEQYMEEIQELNDRLEKELINVNNGEIIEDLRKKHDLELMAVNNDKNQLEQSLSTALHHHKLLNTEMATLKLHLLKKEQDEGQLHQNILTLKGEINDLNSNLEKKFKMEFSENVKTLEEENQRLNKKISAMECNKNDLILVNENVKSLESQLHIVVGEKEVLVEENSKLKAALSIDNNKCTSISHAQDASHENNISAFYIHSKEKDSITVSEIKQLQEEKQVTLTLLEEKSQELDLLQASVNNLSMKVDENNEIIKELEQQKEIIMNDKTQCEEKFVMTKEMVSKLSEIIKEKDQEVCDLKSQLINLSMMAQKCDSINRQLVDAQEYTAQIIQERDQLLQTVHVKHQESVQYHTEIQRLSTVLAQELAKNQLLVAQYTTIVKQCNEEKENASPQHQQEIKQMQDLMKVKDDGLQHLCNRLELKDQELQARGMEMEMLQHQINLMAQDRAAQHGALASTGRHDEDFQEKYNELLSKFQDEQRKSKNVQTELEMCQGREMAFQRELERLRVHLVEIEDTYTQEALKNEERVKELLNKLQQAEEVMKSSSTVYKSANIRANQQVETFQEQARLIAQQRDDVQVKLSSAEDQVGKHSAALRNLQAVLEQFQRDREREIEAARMSVYAKVEAAQKRHDELLEEISSLKFQLREANEGLGAASRLGEELEKKTEIVNRLKQEVVNLEEKVNKAEKEARSVGQTVEAKVDKSLVKNVILGFFLAPSNSKEQVLHVVASVLDFSKDEKSRVQKRLGLHGSEGSGGWFKSLLHPASQDQSNTQSLSEAFVRFLENESIPQPKLKMLPDSDKKASGISNSPRETPPVAAQRKSPLLLADVQLPTFAQFPVGRNSSSILKDILKDS